MPSNNVENESLNEKRVGRYERVKLAVELKKKKKKRWGKHTQIWDKCVWHFMKRGCDGDDKFSATGYNFVIVDKCVYEYHTEKKS